MDVRVVKESIEKYFGENFATNEFVDRIVMVVSTTLIRDTGIIDLPNKVILNIDSLSCEYKYIYPHFTLRMHLLLGMFGYDFYIHWSSVKGYREVAYPFNNAIDYSKVQFGISKLNIEDIKSRYNEFYSVSRNKKEYNYELRESKLISTDIEINIQHEFNSEELSNFIKGLKETIRSYNDKSEMNARKFGLIYNMMVEKEESGQLTLYIDIGSAGHKGIDKILTTLNRVKGIRRVEVSNH